MLACVRVCVCGSAEKEQDPMDVQQEILSLREQLRYHNKKYYDEDAPEITDYD